jgi:thiamine pyrophosphate-dependent acetolactate synthase large subunit-like protein
VDFAKLAASLGMPARHVERAVDIAPAIEAGIASGTAKLIVPPFGAPPHSLANIADDVEDDVEPAVSKPPT